MVPDPKAQRFEFSRDDICDVLGGVWLVTLMFGLLHLPAVVA